MSEFGISQKDKRKYNFLLKNIPSDWLDKPGFLNFNIYDCIIENLNLAGKISKIPKYTYSILLDKCYAEKAKVFWGNTFEDNELDNEDWEEIHLRNFKCTIESRLRSFYFKIFHRAIAFRDFLFKILKNGLSQCCFCQKVPETIMNVILSNLFGWKLIIFFIWILNLIVSCLILEKFLGFLIISFWHILFYVPSTLYRCKFQDKKPHVNGLKSFIKSQREIEYCIAKKKGKLSRHFKKWSFVI